MNKMSSKHFLLFILAIITISIRSYSSIFIEYGGRDTWLISLLAAIIIMLFIYILLKINIKTNTYDINVIFEKSFPKIISIPLKIIFSLGLILITIESASVNASSIHNNYFLYTPMWYCILFLIIPSAYIATKSFNSLLTVVVTIVFFNLVGDIINLVLISKYLNLRLLLPVLGSGLYKNKFMCLVMLIGSLSSFCILLPYMKYLDKKTSLIKNSIVALVIACFFITTSFVSLVSLLGLERAKNIFYPEYAMCQRIKISNFLEFGEIFFIFRNVTMWFLKYILSLYSLLLLYKDKIGNTKIPIIIYTIAIFIISGTITRNQYLLYSNFKTLQLILLIPFVFVPLITFIKYSFNNIRK